jgi:monoamine oxidase
MPMINGGLGFEDYDTLFMKYDILIIGAGAAGLLAMKELLEAGYRVCLLEAAAIAGGRIATVKGFSQPVEAGAEFIHGRLPLTIKLLKKAGIRYEAVAGKMIGVHKGQWNKNEQHEGYWDEMMRKLKRQKEDMTIKAFLNNYFPGTEYKELRNAVRRYAEGFDLADISKASILSVKKEWAHEDQKTFRVNGGYIQLIKYLQDQCRSLGGKFYFNAYVNSAGYSKGNVVVTTNDERQWQASRLIVTASVGLLQSGGISFKPALGVHQTAIRQLGFGPVIKIILQFKTPFWKIKGDDIGFLITDESIPTWWTQLPVQTNILTGWLGGPAAAKRTNDKESLLLSDALQSLSSVFKIETTVLKKWLVHYKISSWQNDPFAKGGYSYCTLFTEKAIEILSRPVDDTVYFAGEGVYNGESQGTVEAALQSGMAVAKKIRRNFKS